MMSNKEKHQINLKIAKILGFKKGNMKINGCVLPKNEQPWHFPDDWQHTVVGSPCWHIPDFVGMLEEHVKLRQSFNGIIKFDYNPDE